MNIIERGKAFESRRSDFSPWGRKTYRHIATARLLICDPKDVASIHPLRSRGAISPAAARIGKAQGPFVPL